MSATKTIIISCAGMGNRLGIGTTKALIDVCGKPLIIRQLELLDNFDDVRIVVGYQADKVIEVVNKYRNDITFVFNHNYMNNGTGASVSLAMEYANEYIVALDGDLLVHPEDIKKILENDIECLGACAISTDDPVLIQVNEIDGLNQAVSFSREVGNFEWTGLVQVKASRLTPGQGHVYQLIEKVLPIPIVEIRSKEIDTMNDYDRAIRWVKNGYSDDKIVIGIVGGMGSYATAHFFKKVLDAFPAEKEWERPRILIDNNCTMPSRVKAILYGDEKERLIRELTGSVNGLITAGANRIVLACNTSHYFKADIGNALSESRNKIIDIIEECATSIQKTGACRVSLLASEGTIETKICENIFSRSGIEILVPNDSQRVKIRDIIEDIKQNKITQKTKQDFVALVLQQSPVVVLGCTELPIIYEQTKELFDSKDIMVFDPLESAIDVLVKQFNEQGEGENK